MEICFGWPKRLRVSGRFPNGMMINRFLVAQVVQGIRGSNGSLEYCTSLSQQHLLFTSHGPATCKAFEAPLPSGWSEHLDPEGRVYFFSQVGDEVVGGAEMKPLMKALAEPLFF